MFRSFIPRLALLLILVALAAPACPAAAQGAEPAVADYRIGTPALRETFREDLDAWDLDSGRSPARSIADGVLTIRVDDAEQLVWSLLDAEYGDFYLEVDSAHLEGPLDNAFGLVFRYVDASDLYLFLASSDGMVSLGKYVDDEWESLLDWESSDAVEDGEGSENRLGLLAAGDSITLFVNNVQVAQVEDDEFSEGQIGLVAAANEKEGVGIAFDNLWLWTKPAARPGRIISRQPSPTITPRPTPTPTRPASRVDATVRSATLNVRGGPSTSYPVVGTLRQGDAVNIVGRSADSQWARIELAGQTQAWVSVPLLNLAIDLADVAVAAAPPLPPTPKPAANVAYLVIENHIGRYITVQVNDQSFQVEGKVGATPGRYRFTLLGVGRYRVAAQLPNGGSHNWDLYVEATAAACAGREGCVALGGTFTQTYY